MFKWNFFNFNLWPLPLVLSEVTTDESGSLFFIPSICYLYAFIRSALNLFSYRLSSRSSLSLSCCHLMIFLALCWNCSSMFSSCIGETRHGHSTPDRNRSTSIQLIYLPLLSILYHLQICIRCTPYPIIQVVNEDFKQCWCQCQPQGYTARDYPPAGLCGTSHEPVLCS